MLKQSFKNIWNLKDKYLIINVAYIISFLVIFLSTNSMMLIFNDEKLKKASNLVLFRYLNPNVVLGILIGVILFILSILTINIGKYMIKIRSKEYSIYLIIAGVQKNYVTNLIWLEQLIQTLLQAIIALVIGLIILVPFNMIFINNVVDAYYLDYSNYFLFEPSSVLIYIMATIFVFILATAVQFIIFYKQNITSLLNSIRQGENTITKVSNKSVIIAIMSFTFLFVLAIVGNISFNYTKNDKLTSIIVLLVLTLLFIIANILLFKSFLPWLFQKLQSIKNINYKGTNSFLLAQINTKIRSFSTIMGAMTIVIVLCLSLISFFNSIDSLVNSSSAKAVVVTSSENKNAPTKQIAKHLQLYSKIHFVHTKNSYYMISSELLKYQQKDSSKQEVILDPYNEKILGDYNSCELVSNLSVLKTKGKVSWFNVFKAGNNTKYIYKMRFEKNMYTNISEMLETSLPIKVILIVALTIPLMLIFVQIVSLFFKFLSSGWNSRQNYNVLKKLGLNNKDMNKTILKETLLILTFPIIVGIIESIVGLIFIINPFLKITFLYEINFYNYIIVFIIFGLIYLILTTIIYFMYKKIILEKKNKHL